MLLMATLQIRIKMSLTINGDTEQLGDLLNEGRLAWGVGSGFQFGRFGPSASQTLPLMAGGEASTTPCELGK